MKKRCTLVLLATDGLSVVACGQDTNTVTESRLVHPSASLEDLATAVLDGLSTADTASLERVRLTEYEHNELIWPELPASDPAANFPVDFAWYNIETRNRAALSELLPRYAGKALGLRHVACQGETQEFETFHVLTDCWVTFSAQARSELHQLFKDVLVMDGGHKIFRYYSDR